MQLPPSALPRATAAAMSMAAALGLEVHEAIPLQVSNRLTLRLRPSETVARVASPRHEAASFEIEVALALGRSRSPVAGLDPRVEPRVYERDGFTITFWMYYEPAADRALPPAAYAAALSRLHAGMRQVDVSAPHFTDRIREAQELVESQARSPKLAAADRRVL